MNTASDLYIANTILQQLGGSGRLNAFLGVTNFFPTPDSLGFRFKARGQHKINLVTVRLMPSDTYTVTFHHVNKNGAKLVRSIDDVYCDELVDRIEKTTGLYLHF